MCPVTYNTAGHIYQDSQRGGAGQDIAVPCAPPMSQLLKPSGKMKVHSLMEKYICLSKSVMQSRIKISGLLETFILRKALSSSAANSAVRRTPVDQCPHQHDALH